MRDDIYTLPQISIVGGQSKTLKFNLWTTNTAMFNAEDCSGNFSVVSYSDKSGEILISKTMTFEAGDDPTVSNVAVVNLLPQDTAYLYGKYIYQITIIDEDGNVEIPNQGILYIAYNIAGVGGTPSSVGAV